MNKIYYNDKNISADISAVIFDLDNTLSDRKYAFSCHAGRMADMFLKEISLKEEFVKELIKLDCNGYAVKKEVYKTVCQKFPLDCSPDEMSSEWDKSAAMFCRQEPFAEDILQYLGKKYTLGLLTNGLSKTQSIKLDGVGLRKYFAEVMISQDTGLEKPDPAIFGLFCGRLGVSPENAVYVGDQYKNDYCGSLSAGLNPILYDRYNEYGGKYTPVIRSLEELKNIL